MPENIDLCERAGARFMKARPLVAGRREEVRVQVIALSPKEHLDLRGGVIVTQPIARSHIDGKVRDIDSAWQLVASGGKLQVIYGTPGEQRAGDVDLRGTHARFVRERRAWRDFVLADHG